MEEGEEGKSLEVSGQHVHVSNCVAGGQGLYWESRAGLLQRQAKAPLKGQTSAGRAS